MSFNQSQHKQGSRFIQRLCLLLLIAALFSTQAAPAFGGEAYAAAKLKAPAYTVTKYGSTELKVKITKLKGADGYRIYRAKKSGGSYAAVKTLTEKKLVASKRIFMDTELKASTRYYYKVRAYQLVDGVKKFGTYGPVKTAVTKAAPNGNASKYDVKNVAKYDVTDGAYKTSPLNGQTAYFLGSSVTKGKGSENDGNGNVSFVEMLAQKYHLNVEKSAVNGTTLIGDPYDKSSDSYVSRLTNKMGSYKAPDYFVCQLSTNDAVKGSPLGTLSDIAPETDIDTLAANTGTVAGAIEYIAAFARDNWGCPVIFYVPTKFKDTKKITESQIKKYEKMIALLKTAAEKWDSQILYIDLYDDKSTQYTSTDDRLLCMYDTQHPTKAGYVLKYVPIFEKFLQDLYEKIAAAMTPDPAPETTTESESISLETTPQATVVDEPTSSESLTVSEPEAMESQGDIAPLQVQTEAADDMAENGAAAGTETDVR